MGGEKKSQTAKKVKRQGSPPHGRGKVVKLCMATGLRRITPAWAGKSTQIRLIGLVCLDHPRMGGEKTKKIP